jgi:DUF1365 family protein
MRTEPHTDMILYTLITFAAFVLWVESYNLRLRLRSLINSVHQTWGRADWVMPVRRERQTWMRTSVKQNY